MKKITSLLVALIMVFALFSCGDDEVEETIVSPFDKFIAIFENSEPTTITTYVTQSNESFTLESKYITTVYGNDHETTYEVQELQYPGPGVNEDEYKKTTTGHVFYHDGLFSTDGGVTWGSETPDNATAMVKFDLDAAGIEVYEISADEKKLSATLTAEQAAALLGVNINSNESGVSLTFDHDGKNLRNITVIYTTENGSTVSIVTSYTYDAVVNPFAPPVADTPETEQE